MIKRAIAWILWVLSSQKWNRAIIGLLFLLILYEFIVKVPSYFLMYSSIKVIYIIIIISERLVFPQYVNEEDARHSTYLDEKWKKLM